MIVAEVLGVLAMNKQQADYCDALASGNVQTWDKGYIVMLTCDEWIQLEKDENRYVSSREAVEREGRAVSVTDKVIIRMINQ